MALLALLALAQLMVILDISALNVALPDLAGDLAISGDDLGWTVTSYSLVFGSLLLLGGRAADLLGRRRVFLAGLGVFTVASLVSALATSEAAFFAARAGQGLGAALLSPAALSIITTSFQGPARAKALGVWGAVGGAGAAIGVLLGGALTDLVDWRAIFLINLPVGIGVAAAAVKVVPADVASPRWRGLDLRGAVIATASLGALVYALSQAADAGWTSAQTLGLGGIALALLASFIAIEQRSKAPLVPFGIFRKRTVTGTNVVALLVAMALFSMFFFISLYMQQVLGYSAIKSGLSYLPLAIGIIVSAGVASTLVTRFGFKPILTSGLILTAIGLVWFAQVDTNGGYLSDILFPSLVAAVGLGFAFVPMTIAAVSGVEAHETGLASGLINTSQQIGGALGLAILAAIANSHTDALMQDAGGAPSALPSALTEGFQLAFMVGAGFAVLGAILSLTLISSRESRAHAEAAQRGELQAVPAPA